MQHILTAHERVQIALRHQEADRVPYAIGGGPYGIVDDLYFRLLRHFDLGEPVAPFRAYDNALLLCRSRSPGPRHASE